MKNGDEKERNVRDGRSGGNRTGVGEKRNIHER